MRDFHDHQLRVRYADTDQMGVAYYANYLIWFEVGRAEFCRHFGFSYRDLELEAGVYLMVVEANCRYLSPLKYDEVFTVRTWLEEFRSRSLTFKYQIRSEGCERIKAEGFTRHIVSGRDGKLRRFPAAFARFLAHLGPAGIESP